MWIVIETFWTPTICTDFEGEVLSWEKEENAKIYADTECQNVLKMIEKKPRMVQLFLSNIFN